MMKISITLCISIKIKGRVKKENTKQKRKHVRLKSNKCQSRFAVLKIASATVQESTEQTYILDIFMHISELIRDLKFMAFHCL